MEGVRTPCLPQMVDVPSHVFLDPVKKINEGQDVSFFLQSKAYSDLMTFLLQLNRAMFPYRIEKSTGHKSQGWTFSSSEAAFSDTVKSLQNLLQKLNDALSDAPPDPGPRRFGNVAFRKWSQIITDITPTLLSQHLPTLPPSSHRELTSYFLGSFGSPQRLDYGSGHELSFLAFLGSIWKLSGFSPTSPSSTPDNESSAIDLGLIQPYLKLIRRLISTYTLEPAGSHGVWGLDDH